MSKRSLYVVVALAGLIATLSAFNSESQSDDKNTGMATNAPPQVSVVTLAHENVHLITELPGRTTAFRTAEVRPQVSGIIHRRLFTEGQQVSLNDPLYQIDPSLWQAEVKQREADLIRAKAHEQTAKNLLVRYNSLIKNNIISRQDYENAESSRNQATADVMGAEAALDTARINLNYTRVLSPLNGIIGRSLVTEGALVTAQQETAIATIQQIDPIYIDIVQSSGELLSIRQRLERGELSPGEERQAAKVTLKLEDGSDYEHPGSLQFSEVTVDRSTGSVVIRAVVPNPDHKLLPGMFVRTYLAQGVAENALLVPQRSLARNSTGQSSILIVNAQNQIERRTVETSHTSGNSWLVTKGVMQGDRVVVEGMQKVRPGITVVPEELRQVKENTAEAATDIKVASNG